MTNEEIIRELQRNGASERLMSELYNQNRGIIYKAAKKFQQSADIEDLMQEAYIALDRAVKCYDLESGYKFNTYLYQALIFHFVSYIATASTSIRVPGQAYSEILKYNRLQKEYLCNYDREPTAEEYKKVYGWDNAKYELIKNTSRILKTVSLYAPLKTDEDCTLADTIKDNYCFEDDIAEVAEREYQINIIRKAVDRLNDSEQTIIKKYYFEGLNQKEIAEITGISHQFVATKRTSALRHLKADKDIRCLYASYERYDSKAAYHYSMQRYNETWLSSVEFIAERNMLECVGA